MQKITKIISFADQEIVLRDKKKQHQKTTQKLNKKPTQTRTIGVLALQYSWLGLTLILSK